ncbi:membrane protein [Rhizocola hellebori]|uniref:Membrane protein n=1 Tax=Rhizocola hellebori TaxID=1392758 RepID=A0A8J3Q690_9ACTN|nr:membrane protein [Rhizocola hellebori]
MTLAGVVLALLVAGRVGVDVGPFRSTFSVTPSVFGDTEVLLPPLGSLQLDTHEGPAHLRISLDGLDQARTEALIEDPATITRASRTAVTDLRSGVNRLVMHATGVAMLGAMFAAAIVYRRIREMAWAGGLSLAVMAGSFGFAALTFHPRALTEPRYEGLLANAPAVVGDAQRLADRYDEYAAQLEKMVVNVGQLYSTVANLPVYTPDDGTIRVLHVSDLHLNPAAWPIIRSAVEQFHINVVVDTGDINDWGSEAEASFVASIALLKVPYVYVRGNHDSAITQAAVAAQPNAVVLDNRVITVAGLTFAGIGDPRFTPDKAVNPLSTGESATTVDMVQQVGERLADTVVNSPRSVDIALVHDPRSAEGLAGVTPLVLAGHAHTRSMTVLDHTKTRLLVQGSTGGAGLRGLEGESPRPLEMSVLYFDPAREFLAYDDITVGGAGLAEVTLKRHLVEPVLLDVEPSVSPS